MGEVHMYVFCVWYVQACMVLSAVISKLFTQGHTLALCRHVVNPSVCSLCPLLKAHSFLKPLSSSPQYFKRWVKYVCLCLCSVLVGAHIVICMFVSGTSVLVGASIVCWLVQALSYQLSYQNCLP